MFAKKKRLKTHALVTLIVLAILLTSFIFIYCAKDKTTASDNGNGQETNELPNTPDNPSPSNGATGQPITVTLSWHCSDPDDDPLTYDVYFGTSDTTLVFKGNQTANSWDPPGDLEYNSYYYWQIVAHDDHEHQTTGIVWNFNTDQFFRFSQPDGYDVGENPSSVFAADFNDDEFADLATVNSSSDNVSVLLNNGDGTFQPANFYSTGNLPGSIFGSDLDADGDVDLAVTNGVSSGNITLLENLGSGTFQFRADIYAWEFPTSIVAGDYDGDNDNDLAVTTHDPDPRFSDYAWTLENSGNWIFTPAISYSINDPHSLFVTDINENNIADLIFGGRNPNSGFSVVCIWSPGVSGVQVDAGITVASVFAACLDDDNLLDIVALGTHGISILINSGDGSFRLEETYGDLPYLRGTFAADLDDDEDNDIVVILLSGGLYIFRNDGNAVFQPPEYHDVGDPQPTSIWMADFNNDTKCDIVFTVGPSNLVFVLINETP